MRSMLDQEVANDIINAVMAQGELALRDALSNFGIEADEFDRIKQLVVLHDQIRLDRSKFKLKADRAGTQDEPTATCTAFEVNWKNHGADRLRDLLRHDELEPLVGHLAYTIRQSRALRTGHDRRGNKLELATALIVRYEEDLFADKVVRQVVAGKVGVPCPKRWVSGKESAVQFVHAVGFPAEFAGTPVDDNLPDYEYLTGRTRMGELADFQREVHAGFLEKLRTSRSRGILTLPTGAGKTRVAVQTIRDWLVESQHNDEFSLRSTVIWLAHTEELCEQAYCCFKDVWNASVDVPPLMLYRFWGSYTRDLDKHDDALSRLRLDPGVIISTPQRLNALINGELGDESQIAQMLKYTAGCVVIDEAHRAAAPTYQALIKTYANTHATILGLTATPFRTHGTDQLVDLFHGQIIRSEQILGDDPARVLQQRGYLAKTQKRSINTHVLLKSREVESDKNMTVEDEHRLDKCYQQYADRPKRRLKIIEELSTTLRADPKARIVYFGPSVIDAECMAYLFREAGISAAFVSGTSRASTRRRIINDFRHGRIRVLCNCEVLTTGFDVPRITHVVMARPTVSRVLYEQMLGRGLRGPKFGGTKFCVVYDCNDDLKEGSPPPVDISQIWAGS